MQTTLARFFVEGGAFMWVILGVLAVGLAVIAERLHFYLRVCRGDAATLVADIARTLNGNSPEADLEAIVDGDAPLDRVLAAAVRRYRDGHGIDEIRQVIDETAIVETPRLRQHLGYLATCANVATLAGLLGTIFGLQQSFSSLAMATAAEKAALLAAGISQAMNTTAFGLIVAIVCMIAHARLASLQVRRLDDLDAGIVRLINYLENGGGARTARGARISA